MSALRALGCLFRLQARTGTALRIKCSPSGSFFLYQSPHTAPARGTETFISDQAASPPRSCAFTDSVVSWPRQHAAHLQFRSMPKLKNLSEILSWEHTAILESTNIPSTSQLAETESGRETRTATNASVPTGGATPCVSGRDPQGAALRSGSSRADSKGKDLSGSSLWQTELL